MALVTRDEIEDDGAATGGRDGPGDADDAAPPHRRGRWAALALVAAAAVVVAVALLVLRDDDADDDLPTAAPDRELPQPPPTIGAEIDAEGQELLALLEAGAELTYHATYTVEGDPAVIGNELRIEVWRSDGRVRQDMYQTTDRAVIETASFLLAGEQAVSCQRIDQSEWRCARQSSTDELTASGMFGNIARELEGADVLATDEEVAGRPARCFSLTAPSGEVSQCVSEEGIPLRLRGGGAELRLSELSDDVPEDIFTPPADVETGAT